LSNKEIGTIFNLDGRTISYWVGKHELKHLMKYQPIQYVEDFFRKIDTPEKAYILGFILGDGAIDKSLEIALALSDKEVLEFIQQNIGGNITTSTYLNKETRRFPRTRLAIHNKKIVNDVVTKLGGSLNIDRRVPIISANMERYFILGFFDADGCITWGRRKDRGHINKRIWQKVSFTGQLKALEGTQKILLKNGISSVIRPKGTEKCFVLYFSHHDDILKFLKYIYDDEFIVLKRKYIKAIALRHELGEFGGTFIIED
jgi:hypothetical protein